MDKLWKAKWITSREFLGLSPLNVFKKEYAPSTIPPHINELKNNHMLIRKIFMISKGFNQAFIDITGDDFYKLYINGQYVCEGPAPGYYFHYYYNRIDITDYLQVGENVVCVHLYYQGLINRVWCSGDYRQGMIAEVSVDDQLIVKTDKTWKFHLSKAYIGSKVIGYDTQYLEDFDSNFWDESWNQLVFDDSSWGYVSENHTFDHKLYLQDTPHVSRYEIKPKIIKEIKANHYMIDFGQELTGLLHLKASGLKGSQIEIRSGEELIESSRVRFNMRCNCTYQEFWTLSGKEQEPIHFYDYKAFRYVEVIGEGVHIESISAYVRHYPFNEKNTSLKSSDLYLNQVWELCKQSVKYGSQEVFVDCPSREKGQYLGDMTITGLSHLYLSNDLRLYKKALKDFSYSTVVCSGLMAVAPSGLMQEIADYSLQYPMQVLTYYKHSGDLEFLREMLVVCENIIDYFRKYQRQDGLIENVKEKWNLVDWPEEARDNYDFPLTRPVTDGCHNVINAFFYGAINSVNEIKDILGIPYEDELPQLKQAFNCAFFNQETGLYVDCEHSNHSALHANMLPVFFSIVEKNDLPSVIQFMKDKRLSCGVYMAYFYLSALCQAGEYEFVYDIITSDDSHSWVNMIKEGATTTFEAWGKDQKWNTSLLHPWASGPIPIIIEHLLGITYEPGYHNIQVNPKIINKVDTLEFKIILKETIVHIMINQGKLVVEMN